MLAAIFGLVGVLVGGLLTGGFDYFMAWRRDRLDVRAASRVVAGELLLNAMHLVSAAQSHRWNPIRMNRRDRYEECSMTLARALPGDDERDLSSAYVALRTVELAAEQARWADFTADDWTTLVDALTAIRSGLDALNRHTAMPSRGEDIGLGLGSPPG
jgi:hypothetical protein